MYPWNSYMISECKENISGTEKEEEKERKGGNEGWLLKRNPIEELLSSSFLLLNIFSLLYFRSQSCNGFTPLYFLLIVIFFVESLTFGYKQFRHIFPIYGSNFVFLIGNNQSKPTMMSSQFPVKVWAIIFSYLDFPTLQKKTTLVCKHWHEMIRSDPTLSGHLALHPPLKPPDHRWI